MRETRLRRKILISFLAVIALLSLLTSLLGVYVVKKYVVRQTQVRANNDLRILKALAETRLEKMKTAFELAGPGEVSEDFKKTAGLDYLVWVKGPSQAKSEIVRRAFETASAVRGYRRIGKEELLSMGEEYLKKSRVPVRQAAEPGPSEAAVLQEALSAEYARPFPDGQGKITGVLYGGLILNGNSDWIDGMAGAIFEKEFYEGRPTGVVTLFLDDLRIATGVLDGKGERAVGTRLAENVYERVIRSGKPWLDRAFVVSDWYLTAYEPLRDIEGRTLGVISLGILERPFLHARVRLTLVFIGIIVTASVFAGLLAWALAHSLARPLTLTLRALLKISEGNWENRMDAGTSTREFNQLAESVNEMAEKISQRERRLEVSNEKLAALNKTYLDLIGFVSHELKGIISSAVMNVYSLREEYLGALNLKQKEALSALAKSLDYLSTMVRHFLSLSQIEKGEMTVNLADVFLKEQVVDAAVETFAKLAEEKKAQILNKVQPQIPVRGDEDLLRIAASNLVSNAVKYCTENGTIILTSKDKGDEVILEVYNDGAPIPEPDQEKLFKRFSRIPEASGKTKGTGLGLFITKEIIGAHGGRIWVETRPFGNLFAISLKKSSKAQDNQPAEAVLKSKGQES